MTPTEPAPPTLYVEVLDDLRTIAAADWDALAGPDNPFVEHAFLAALEESGSVAPETGWIPQHLVVRPGDAHGPDRAAPLLGAAPAYLKLHSYGEYIFDFAWAQAAARPGLRYYPKLLLAVPFTPATGPRLLVRPGADVHAVSRALAEGAASLAEHSGLSGAHVLFSTDAEAARLATLGYSRRLSLQFHWHNAGYRDFDDYLDAFSAKRRKEIRRERRRAAAHGLTLRVLPGDALRPDHWRALEAFYRRTVAARGGTDYLTPRFFALLPERLAHRVVAVIAERDGRPVAGTLNFHKGSHLYGRYWGALEDLDALHFECCYHQLIEHAIAGGYSRFEAGAQGHHKLARGLLPSFTHSAHLLLHPGLAQAVDAFLLRETDHVRAEHAALSEHSPFREAVPPGP